jgi:pimeloyl-ACP methyl ester carboxylesterase
MKLSHLVLALVSCSLLASTSGSARIQTPPPGCATITAANVDDCVRLNEIQMLGTHNSYHVAQPAPMLAALGARARDLEYTHRPLAEQLAMGIRQVELDVFFDPKGGHFATPAALRMVEGLEPVGREWREPGFKVFHVQDIDYRTTCAALKVCLRAIRDWSRANPSHVPILILIEAKDGAIADPDGRGFVKPLPIDVDALRALDDEIRSVFDEDHMLTPDRVRGKHATLAAAIRAEGWPLLKASRGKVLFALDNTDVHRTDYLRGNPSLERRPMFVTSTPDEPAAAFVKMNEARGEDEGRIRENVKGRFLIRTRADVPTDEARSGSTVRRDSAFRSGAHYVSTDYPEESPFGSGYRARLPGAEGLAARCNPVNAPAGCKDEWLEPKRQASTAPPPPGRLVDIGGWRMHINCTGEARAGRPTVVLDAGSSDSSVEWSLVQPGVAAFARVCSYDRSGTGWSELGPYPHTDRQIIYELGALLEAAGEKPPFVMVGHSMGGRYAQLFTVARRADVAGVVLVDSNHEDDLLYINGTMRRLWETAVGKPVPPVLKSGPLKWETLPAALRSQLEEAARQNAGRAVGAPFDKLPLAAQQARQWMQSQPAWMAANNSPFTAEEVAETKAERKKNPQPFGDLPLIVLARGTPLTGERVEERTEARKRNMAALAALSSRGQLIVAARSGHHIHIDEPEVVVSAIEDVVTRAQSPAR